MKQILVFGIGVGGETVADYLEGELSTVEVIRKIDERNIFYDDMLPNERAQAIIEQLRPYLGQVDVIVLGSYLLSLSLPYLRQCFPEQTFIGMGVNIYRVAQNMPGSTPVIALMNPATHDSLWFDELCLDLDFVRLSIPNCAGWEQLIDDHSISPDILRADLSEVDSALRHRFSYQRRGRPRRSAPPLVEQISIEYTENNKQTAAQSMLQIRDNIEKNLRPNASVKIPTTRSSLVAYKKPPISARNKGPLHSPAQQSNPRRTASDLPRLPTRENSSSPILSNTPGLVLLLSTHFWSIKPELKQIFGWRVKILDFRTQLLHDVCFALGLRGVHGNRAR